MVYGGGEIRIRELNSDVTGLESDGVDQVIIENANIAFGKSEVGGLPAEGSQLFKKDGKYYLFLIASPRSRWSRSVLIYRADRITGPYEGRVALQDQGVAQGGLIETPEGDWYSYLFGDRGAVGRIPYLVPVDWEDDWPVIGIDGKVPETLDLPMRSSSIPQIVAPDDFERSENDLELPLVWQWNHNPDNQHWSILDDPGRLRITTSRIDHSVLTARNTLTQRTFGPVCSASVKIDVSGMRDGDIAGLIALQRNYGFVGAKLDGGRLSVIATRAPRSSDEQIETVSLHQTKLYLRIDCDYRNQADVANFFYSLDGRKWKRIGRTLKMSYTMPHFMGYRFGLFNYATANPGGYVDFDDFTLDNQADFQ
jgi:beta-xylosidase